MALYFTQLDGNGWQTSEVCLEAVDNAADVLKSSLISKEAIFESTAIAPPQGGKFTFDGREYEIEVGGPGPPNPFGELTRDKIVRMMLCLGFEIMFMIIGIVASKKFEDVNIFYKVRLFFFPRQIIIFVAL